MTDQSRLTWALAVSVLLHGLLLSLLPTLRRAPIEFPNPAQLLDVDVLPLPKAPPPPAPAAAVPAAPPIAVPKQQIVSPPDEGEEKAPANPRFLSDRDNVVKEEMVHRGEPAAGSPDAARKAPPQQVASAKAARPEPATNARQGRTDSRPAAALPKLDQLLPPAGDLIREGLVTPHEGAPKAAPEQQLASSERTDLLRHGDPWKQGNLHGGTLDFLPTVHEGDITLLNTKAEQFAPFVRRVAMRVLENLRIFLRRSLGGAGVHGAQEFATVEAVMDRSGRLISLTTKERSAQGALDSDRNLQAACREGFFDRNPPDGAQSADGNIHFLFEVRVALIADARGPVGYNGLFAAGLL
jgi:hypothetical protein